MGYPGHKAVKKRARIPAQASWTPKLTEVPQGDTHTKEKQENQSSG